MTAGIYCIENTLTGDRYIGKDSNIPTRWKRHVWELRKNIHANKYLQRSWNKYGEENFSYCVIEECSLYELGEKENFYIDSLSTLIPNGFNMTRGGEYGILGFHHTEETRKKMSETAKLRLINPKNRPMLGKHHSEETRSRISESNTGKHSSQETKQKLSETHVGMKYKTASSKYIGISIGYKKDYWRSWVNVNGEVIDLGRSYKTELEAAIARDNYIVQHRLDMVLNFPDRY